MSAIEGLASFNAVSSADAVRALRRCCASTSWAQTVAAGRPYTSAAQLYDVADAALAGLDDAGIDEALAGHPRIGERRPGADGARSRREQSGVAAGPNDTLKAIAEGNRAYEERFGYVYLVCATGRNADELLDLLRRRLGNDPETERAVMREELGRINRIRLALLVEPEEEPMSTTRSAVTTHVLDTALGLPAAGVPVRLEHADGSTVATARTDDDGRVADLGPRRLGAGTYRVVFDTAVYFRATGQDGFYPEVVVTFALADPAQHYHVPVLLAPYAYSTYRGS